MEMNSNRIPKGKIAIIAKYPFYIDDIQTELLSLDIQIISGNEISYIQKFIDKGDFFDYVFFPHYSKIISAEFLKQQKCIGFHTGDLPKDRGGSPIQNKILRGEYLTSISALNLIEEVDAGDILCQESVSLEHGSIDELLRKISKVIAKQIKMILTNNLTPIPQDSSKSNHQRLKPQASELKIENLSLKQIYDRIRMLDGLDYPRAYIDLGQHRIYLSSAELQDNSLNFNSNLEEKKNGA
jgi:methionyl-tRNA formyltransferase